jgi:N-methylhydantoinase B/oxoprolinase/acetone carboxylase alpha subunit
VAGPYTVGYTQYGVRTAVVGPEVPNNAGSLAAIDVVAPEGSVLNATFPAATASRHMVAHALPGLVMRALADAGSPRCMADSAGGTWGLVLHRPANAGSGSSMINVPGGNGARRTANGLTARHFPANITFIPVEILESDGFIRYRRRARRVGSGGVGRFAGGDGLDVELELIEDTIVTALCERTTHGPDGAQGGADGAPGIVKVDGQVAPPKFKRTLPTGSRIQLQTPGGGGWGTPSTATTAG